MRQKRGGVALAALVLGASACTTFADPTTVIDVRVLAVQTDPSEVFLKVTGLPDPTASPPAPLNPLALGIDPTSIPVIQVDPLIANPAGATVTWTLSACPNDPYGASPPGSVMGGGGVDPGGGANSTVGSTLCDGARVVLPSVSGTFTAGATADVQVSAPDLLAAFEADIYVDQFGQPHGGFDLGMPLNLQLDVLSDGVLTVQAIKRVTFWAQTWPDQMLNQIPALPGVSLFTHRDEATFDLTDAAGPLDLATPTHAPTPIPVALDTGLWFLPAYEEGVTDETYAATVINREPPYQAIEAPGQQERIRYAYYATAGHFDPARTVNELAPGATGTVHLESQYIPPPTLDQVPVDAATGRRLVTVWVVVRDDRGGESWVQGLLALD